MIQSSIPVCCPLCRTGVTPGSEGYHCDSCRRLYPVVLGIPDFRISPATHFDSAADLETATVLVEEEKDLDLEGLLHLYYKLRPEPSEKLHEEHMAHLTGEEDQARHALDEIEECRPLEVGDAVLEVGCGLGQYLAVAAERVDHVAGVDVSLAILVLARKRLGSHGMLVAAEAERLPFPDDAFAAVIAADVIEHLASQEQSLAEMGRVLAANGALFLSTPNRLSLAAEPHVGLWGIGYLPRRLAVRYVRRRCGIFYDDVRLLSSYSLRRMLQKHFPGPARLMIPALSPRQIERFSGLKRALARLYLALRRVPLLNNVFYVFGPFFHVVAVKR